MLPQPHSLLTQLRPEARHRSRRMELDLDAVDGSACSKTYRFHVKSKYGFSVPSIEIVFVYLD